MPRRSRSWCGSRCAPAAKPTSTAWLPVRRQASAHEPGTLVYTCHTVSGAPRERVFYELYRDRAAFSDHREQPHTRRFLAEREALPESVQVDFHALTDCKLPVPRQPFGPAPGQQTSPTNDHCPGRDERPSRLLTGLVSAGSPGCRRSAYGAMWVAAPRSASSVSQQALTRRPGCRAERRLGARLSGTPTTVCNPDHDHPGTGHTVYLCIGTAKREYPVLPLLVRCFGGRATWPASQLRPEMQRGCGLPCRCRLPDAPPIVPRDLPDVY
jgi:quinol monooxygenase YgiN